MLSNLFKNKKPEIIPSLKMDPKSTIFYKLLISIFHMFINIIKTYRDVIAICDAELLGKYFEQGKFQLDIKESFYGGERYSEEQALEVIKKMSAEDSTFNIVGKKSVNTALKAEIISEGGIKKIQGIPFALVLM